MMKLFKFNYKEFTLIIETNHLYVLKTITLLKNGKELEKITDAFIISEENIKKINKMLKFFDDKTKKEIINFIKELD